MSCKLKLDLPLNKLNKINENLFKPYEISGVIKFDSNDNVIDVSINKGDADSVYTPNNVINFHTHPISAYNQGETIWGWPSGEDIRETMKFALSGNKAHLVFTVEGLYTIQVSPCKIKKMQNLLTSEERGVLIFLIEEYFKTTHNFRGIEEVKNLGSKNIDINPYSYINFINNFDISNLVSSKTILHKKPKNEKNEYGQSFSKIPNIGFPELEDNYITNIPMKDYISKEDLLNINPISKTGDEIPNISLKNVLNKFSKILRIFKSKKCQGSWNSKNPNAWFWVNFFPSDQYPNRNVKNVSLSGKPYIKIFSTNSEGCSVAQISKINKFDSISTSARSNTFGNGLITPQQRFLLYNFLMTNSSDQVSDINNYITKNKLKVPKVTQDQVDNELRRLNMH